ncbi:MAG TPA: hypothetical protein VMU95_08505 [Trebonia sp.]|nr:hypothetical protein [Trebonia sp.]
MTTSPEASREPGDLAVSGTPGSAESSAEAGHVTAQAPGPRPALSERLPTPWLFPVLAFAVSWVLILAAWQVANAVYGTAWSWSKYFLYGDGSGFNWIAVHAYSAIWESTPPVSRTAFFPVLPELVRTTGYMTKHQYLPAEVLVQVIAGLASAVAVWALAAHVKDRRVADRAVLLYVAFPGAMTFGLLYPEPMGNALAAISLLAVLNRKWLAAGLLAMVASAVHPGLIVLTPVLAVAAFEAIRRRREWAALIAPGLAPLGMVGYFGLLSGEYHDFFFYFRYAGGSWLQRVDWVGHELRVLTWTDPAVSRYAFLNAVLIIMALALIAGIALMLAARVPVPVSLYTVLVALSLGMASTPGPTPRLAWTALGIFIGVAAKVPAWLFWSLLAVSAALLVFLYGWWPHQGLGIAP